MPPQGQLPSSVTGSARAYGLLPPSDRPVGLDVAIAVAKSSSSNPTPSLSLYISSGETQQRASTRLAGGIGRTLLRPTPTEVCGSAVRDRDPPTRDFFQRPKNSRHRAGMVRSSKAPCRTLQRTSLIGRSPSTDTGIKRIGTAPRCPSDRAAWTKGPSPAVSVNPYFKRCRVISKSHAMSSCSLLKQLQCEAWLPT
jgi:hypothetical protein